MLRVGTLSKSTQNDGLKSEDQKMRDFSSLDPYTLSGEDRKKALDELNRIAHDTKEGNIDRFKALDIIFRDIRRQEERIAKARANVMGLMHDLQMFQIEQFKATRIVMFMERYGAEVEKGIMGPEASKEWRKIDDKYNNSCYPFAEDCITVYERECPSCSKRGCKYHPDREVK
jgi:hypothetical protein